MRPSGVRDGEIILIGYQRTVDEVSEIQSAMQMKIIRNIHVPVINKTIVCVP